MRDRHDPQATMLAFVHLEERVPNDHPLRIIKTVADEALDRLSPVFDRMYSKVRQGVSAARATAEGIVAHLPVLGAEGASLPRGT